MRWANSTHRPPRCGVCNSHLRLRLRIRRSIQKGRQNTAPSGCWGYSWSSPITRPAREAGFFVPSHQMWWPGIDWDSALLLREKRGPLHPPLLNALPPSSGSTHSVISRYRVPGSPPSVCGIASRHIWKRWFPEQYPSDGGSRWLNKSLRWGRRINRISQTLASQAKPGFPVKPGPLAEPWGL